MVCHRCQTKAFKFGFNPQGLQRYRCKQCGKTFSDIPERPLGDLRIEPEKAFQVIRLLCEGTGIRACERLTGLNRRTVLGILETAGAKCAQLLNYRLRGVTAEHIEVDELWAFVFCKQQRVKPFHPEHGDQYTYLAIDQRTKLIISFLVGKRTYQNTNEFVRDLHSRLANRIQLSTDGFPGYTDRNGAVHRAFGDNVDYGIEVKWFGNQEQSDGRGPVRYSQPRCSRCERTALIGNPGRDTITINHAERTNLSLRIFTRRFTRLTLGYSKKLENLCHAVALFIAHFNFCRVHSAHKQTPAMAAGIADHVWTVAELLAAS